MTTYRDLTKYGDVVSAWNARRRIGPRAVGLRYFDAVLTVEEMDSLANTLAVSLIAEGIQAGDRIGISLQNNPYFPLMMLAVWKSGGTVLLLNPAYRQEELAFLLRDSQASGVVCSPDSVDLILASADRSQLRFVWTASGADFGSREDFRIAKESSPTTDMIDVSTIIDIHREAGAPDRTRERQSAALLAYTSGTTGPPKGAVNTDHNILSVISSYGPAVGVDQTDVVLAVAPFFHITGAVVTASLALLGGCELVMIGRFHPELAAEALVEHSVTHTIGAITAFNAMSRLDRVGKDEFRTVRSLYSGGAPVPPALVEDFESRFGVYIHNAYGMTETTSGVIAVPLGERAPVDPESGTLSIGRVLPGVEIRIVDQQGQDLCAGRIGELQIKGPQVISGYWRDTEANVATFEESWLKSGDVAFLDENGWVYLVDRLKDQINVSGYKVWPREVEDVLYRHPSVHEAAVVGRADDYQGESVVAFVAVHPGMPVSEQELKDFVRERLAPYKIPRAIQFLSDLPKTQTGKIKRRELRSVNGHDL